MESEPKISLGNIRVQGSNSSALIVGETEFYLKLNAEKIVVDAIILKHLKFRADILIGSDLIEKKRTRSFRMLKNTFLLMVL